MIPSKLEKYAFVTRSWLDECIASHTSCQKRARHCAIFCTDNCHMITDYDEKRMNPARLLSIRSSSCEDHEDDTDRVYLVEGQSLGEGSHYIALSHRWGARSGITLSKGNKADLIHKGLRMEDLPPTFRDSVHFVRSLGYSYLWVDSLCIVQDDSEDWKQEAQRMSIIFDKATLTIAAMDGGDSYSGLLLNQTSEKDVGTLDSRAWVCQERMMTPRTVLFSGGEISWECRECESSNDGQRMRPRNNQSALINKEMHLKDMYTFFRDWRPKPIASANPESPEATQADADGTHADMIDEYADSVMYDPATNVVQIKYGDDIPAHREHLRNYFNRNGMENGEIMRIYPEDNANDPFGKFMKSVTALDHARDVYFPFMKIWWQFLSLYTARQLTFESDRFLAMNGVATIAQRWTHLRSSFGLWYHFFIYELCWYIDPTGNPARRPSTWLGPTWSWISTTEGRVQNDVYKWLPVEGKLQLKSEIRTPVGTSFDMPLPLEAWTCSAEHYGMSIWGNLREATIVATKGQNGQVSYSVNVDALGRFSDKEVLDFRPDCPDQFPAGEDVEVLCLHVWHYDAHYLELDEYTDLYLVVRQVAGKVKLRRRTEETSVNELEGERRMERLGLLVVKYGSGEKRPAEDIGGIWWYIELV